MSTRITMQDLEAEQAELLPSRETLCCCGGQHSSGSSLYQVGNGNTAQSGWFDVSVLNGNLSGNTIVIG
jgi:hypothetical protein